MERLGQSLIDTHRQELCDLWQGSAQPMALLSERVEGHAEAIVAAFYRQLQTHAGAMEYLSADLIKQRLRKGVTAWLKEVLSSHGPEDAERFMDNQVRLGRMHADIDIPLPLFLLGLRILKKAIITGLIEDLPADLRHATMLYVNSLLDLVLVVAAESYNDESSELMRDLQRMRMSIPTESLQLICEQTRSSLMQWYANLLGILHQSPVREGDIKTLVDAEVGLWLEHKAPLLFPDNQTLDKLVTTCHEIDALVLQAIDHHRQQDWEAHSGIVQQLEKKLRQADSLLTGLAHELTEMEVRTDPLTRLFNRRHLATVMHFESQHAHRSGHDFGLLLIDLDHFKRINDDYGHDAGDRVLKRVAEHLSDAVRSSDFVFRYGGEEFLVVLPEISAVMLQKVADKICTLMRGLRLELPGGKDLGITVSIGIALSGGELNYEHTITRADQALYQAKEAGRDRCVMAPPPE